MNANSVGIQVYIALLLAVVAAVASEVRQGGVQQVASLLSVGVVSEMTASAGAVGEDTSRMVRPP